MCIYSVNALENFDAFCNFGYKSRCFLQKHRGISKIMVVLESFVRIKKEHSLLGCWRHDQESKIT